MTSYLSLIKTMRLPCAVFNIRRVIRGNLPPILTPPAVGTPIEGDPVQNSIKNLVSEN